MKLCVILSLFFVLCDSYTKYPQITIPQGTIRGFYDETINKRQISSFLGIPYAKPPVQNLRFKEPVSSEPWLGILNATKFSPDCLQYSHSYYKTDRAVYGSEDCLYLNIFVPEKPKKLNDLDVLVYIHGGAFMFLSGSEFGPKFLLDRDVILVTLNYRLGILGFLSTGDLVVPGNNGLKDQQMALKWIHDNIKHFGGNPGKITISGMSAGGASVHYQILNPQNKGLFKKAIMLSGSALCSWAQIENSKEKAQKIADELGCPTKDSQSMVDCLRQRSGHHIVSLSKLFMPWLYNPFTPFGPVVEPTHASAFIDKPPSYIIINKIAIDVPILISLTKDEGLYPGAEILANPHLVNDLDKNWGNIIPHLLDFNYTSDAKTSASEKIRAKYFKNSKILDNKKGLVKMISDRIFNIPVSVAAKLHAEYLSSDIHAMMFSYIGKTGLQDVYSLTRNVYSGASHADDLSYVLRTEYIHLEDDIDAMKMSKRMIDIWMNFIQGKPLAKKWLPLDKNLPKYSYLNIKSTDPFTDEYVQKDNFGEYDFWKTIDLEEDQYKISKNMRNEL